MPTPKTYDNREKALRSWDDVFLEFNKRHPDSPIPTPKTVRTMGAKAMAKIKKELLKQRCGPEP